MYRPNRFWSAAYPYASQYALRNPDAPKGRTKAPSTKKEYNDLIRELSTKIVQALGASADGSDRRSAYRDAAFMLSAVAHGIQENRGLPTQIQRFAEMCVRLVTGYGYDSSELVDLIGMANDGYSGGLAPAEISNSNLFDTVKQLLNGFMTDSGDESQIRSKKAGASLKVFAKSISATVAYEVYYVYPKYTSLSEYAEKRVDIVMSLKEAVNSSIAASEDARNMFPLLPSVREQKRRRS